MQNVYVQITNQVGSTIASPVTVQASVMSDFGGLLPQRLKQLAQTITDSSEKNLGLNNSVFGKVKSINLSSYLKGTLHATPPSPSPSPAPSPSPELSDHSEPSISPSLALPPSNLPIVNHPSPAPSIVTAHPPHPCPYRAFTNHPSPSPTAHSHPTVPSAFSPSSATPYSPPLGPTSQFSPDLSPIPKVSYASSLGHDKGSAKGLSPSLAPSPCKLHLLSNDFLFCLYLKWFSTC